MPQPRPDLRRGRIVWAAVRDRRGIEKHRPAIILTATQDISENEPLEVMAVTTTFADPPPKDHVPIPWSARGHPVTKLNRRSAAVISWLDSIATSDVLELAGDVPPKLMIQILEMLDGA